MILVNLYGAPGSGKSTGAAYIFSKLKMAGVDAELVTEFAKDKVWEESKAPFDN
jgi:adenylate kinase family enzyme